MEKETILEKFQIMISEVFGWILIGVGVGVGFSGILMWVLYMNKII